jgi:GT2 family glycosyltransferase
MSDPLLFVIVLNNNSRDDTVACLKSLTQSDYQNFKIILLDLASGQDTIEFFHNEFPQIQIIPLIENLGYAGNNNIGIKAALEQGAEWLLILNNDTVLGVSCLSSLMHAGSRDSSVGVVGPLVYHYDEPDVIQSAGGVFDKDWRNIHLGLNEPDCGQYNAITEVDWVSGCAIMVRCALVEQVGPLDPDYFLYWEETEWCIRASRAGWKVVHVPYAKIWHKGVKRSYEPRAYVTYYMTRNYLFTLTKHKASFLVRIHAMARIFKTLLSWSIKPQWKNKRDHRNAMWRGLLDFLNHRMGPMPS